jgi:tetratricopeptide (TPR) repeat protein
MLSMSTQRQKIALIVFGVFLFFVLLEGGMRLGGLILSLLQEHRNQVSLKHKDVFRIMCLGESTTAQGGPDSYPSQLEEILNQSNIGIRFSVINKGLRATNTSIILSELEGNIAKYRPDMVITMMGINDGGPHMPHDMPTLSPVVSFLRSLKIYKLLQYLLLHFEAKFRTLGALFHITRLCYAAQTSVDNLVVLLEKEISQNPLAETPRVHLGNYYRANKQYSHAEAVYKQALALIPGSAQLNLELARLYRDQVRYDPAVQYYKNVLALDPKNRYAYVELGRFYRDQLKLKEAEDLLNKAITINPSLAGAYRELAFFYSEREDFTRAEELFRKALELDPKDAYTYIQFGRYYVSGYRWKKEYDLAESLFKKAIEIDPKNDDAGAYHELGRVSREIKKYAQAEECFRNAIALNPRDELAYAGLALAYEEEGKKDLAARAYQKLQELRYAFYSPLTAQNYRHIKAVLDRHHVSLVCVQYPMRALDLLRAIFNDASDIIFVDNEQIFKHAVRNTGYDDYFVDMFGADFGHCTRRGNRLLAENIANTILKEYFEKRKIIFGRLHS